MSNIDTIVPLPLDTLTFPLHGARLIEASAGTGKTFTIAGLYLRLLLGHGTLQTRHNQALTVDQILVVTFTEAATAELRDRIRRRIHEARIAFSRGSSHDPVVKPLLEQITDHAFAAQLLLNAERQMDQAAIYTIHGFCQRMLTQNAFESGMRFDHEFITDESQLKAQVVADYWRRQFYPLPINLAGEIRRLWPSPQALLDSIGRYLSGEALCFIPPMMSDDLAALHQSQLAKIEAVKQQWRAVEQDIETIISHSDVNKRSYTKKSLPEWIKRVSSWAASATITYDIPDVLSRFSQSVLIEKTPKGNAPHHPLFVTIDSFLAQPVGLQGPLMAHAITVCRQLLSNAKSSQQWLSFDDLLSQLSASLAQDEQGILAERIRQLYPVAMIDEFQDTDPLQYHIFSHVYLAHPTCGWFMIGDPKQAIYAFRGADIFTYITARNQVTAHYTLGTNWRSSAQMVAAVNQLFTQPDSPFIYDKDIPFYPVQASPKASQKQWFLAGQVQPALTYWYQQADAPVSKGDYQKIMADATASQIQKLLTAAQQGEAYFELHRAIEPANIAVLVRTGSEGRLIQQALAQQGIASVYLSNRDSVFSSVVAADIQRLLLAVLHPEDEKALRSALASPLFALNAAQLDLLNNDENEWETVQHEFKYYRKLWQERGVLPMLRSVLSQRHIAERWLAETHGERQLTDFMHLSELLQQATQMLESDHGLLRWFAQSIEDAQAGSSHDDAMLRLESERNLVQIVTIHKSKGLEYDLVFLPFALSYRVAQEGKYYDLTSGKTVLDMMKSDAALQQADKERLAEDLRLIYVALTRAVYGCFVGVAPLRNGRSTKEPTGVHLSALGYLLQNGQLGDIATLTRVLSQQVTLNSVVVTDPPEPQLEPFSPFNVSQPELSAETLQVSIDRSWRVTSYSGLLKQGTPRQEGVLEPIGFDIDSAGEQDERLLTDGSERSIFTFPRGATPGTFLHAIFEDVEFTESAYSENNRMTIESLMARYQIEPEWLEVLQNLVETVLSTPLDGQALSLNQMAPTQRLTEMEFLLPIELLTAPELNRMAHRYDPLSAQAGELGFYPVQGMLKGFIDLVFEYKGKYYLLDWKSNHLGDERQAYQGESLERAMVEHRYDLQYQLYTLALHRFLRSRLADYDYQVHFGGVYYLFLRGMDGQSPCGVFYAKPSFEFIQSLERAIDGQTALPPVNDLGQMEFDL
ncbi:MULTISPECIES: exodeoxyribonuclease V subunit beta [unclassified Vibrio]|uniref:exodeoxyribonuclease V subunit beta n=1 Tax=unclassified Vibrio TaxID=2614977 RepID=UPI0014838245|nr:MULTISPECIES: exodeoxyribonuclease V subunit beta [unclassified Vibrio]NNN44398.1 exodeoxyribonuclease V subunit beta [Vibrio sp. 1-1(7)]NNN72914.1 exodeoxyribonuclease V subunit beta [Vibrio sp. 12-2(3-a)]